MKHNGYALVTLLVYMTTAMIVTTAAIMIIVTNTKATTLFSASEEALAIAEAGTDNAVLRLLRNQNYAGEVLSIGNGTVTITVTGTSTKTITADAVVGATRRKVQSTGTFSNTVFTVSTWREVP